jgi:hypothetical protein
MAETPEKLLARAGLELLGSFPDVRGIRVSHVYAAVMRGDAKPASVVNYENGPADYLAECDRRWFELSAETGMIDGRGEFYVSFEAQSVWYKVRFSGPLRLAEELHSDDGWPDFVTVASDGRVAIGVTTEEYELWLVVVREGLA